jgi:hypothetical protein
VLAAGMRLGAVRAAPAAPTGVVFTIEPELEQCVICTEPMSGAVSEDNPFIVLECQHAFHVRCISSWAEGKMEPLCPFCRVPITEHDIDDLGSVYVGGRKVRVQRPDGSVTFYEGEKGAERKVRVERPSGEKYFYEGEKGAERMVRVARPRGEKYFDAGEKGAERMVRVERPDGEKQFFEGEKDAERKVRAEFPDGTVHFYEGVKGAERIVRVEEPRAKRMRTRALVGRRGPTL